MSQRWQLNHHVLTCSENWLKSPGWTATLILLPKAARICLEAREAGWEEFEILKNALTQAGQTEEAAELAVSYLPNMPEHPRRMKEALQSLARDEKYAQLTRLSEVLPEDAFDNPFLIYHLALGGFAETG